VNDAHAFPAEDRTVRAAGSRGGAECAEKDVLSSASPRLRVRLLWTVGRRRSGILGGLPPALEALPQLSPGSGL